MSALLKISQLIIIVIIMTRIHPQIGKGGDRCERCPYNHLVTGFRSLRHTHYGGNGICNLSETLQVISASTSTTIQTICFPLSPCYIIYMTATMSTESSVVLIFCPHYCLLNCVRAGTNYIIGHANLYTLQSQSQGRWPQLHKL